MASSKRDISLYPLLKLPAAQGPSGSVTRAAEDSQPPRPHNEVAAYNCR